jgi:hypothetical protein
MGHEYDVSGSVFVEVNSLNESLNVVVFGDYDSFPSPVFYVRDFVRAILLKKTNGDFITQSSRIEVSVESIESNQSIKPYL